MQIRLGICHLAFQPYLSSRYANPVPNMSSRIPAISLIKICKSGADPLFHFVESFGAVFLLRPSLHLPCQCAALCKPGHMHTRILTDAVGADPALSPHSPFVGETALQGEIRLQEGLEIISGIFTWCIAGSRLWIKHRIFFVRFKYKNIPENVIEIPDGPEELIAYIREQLKKREEYYTKAKYTLDVSLMDNYEKIKISVEKLKELLEL